jgi:DNA-binding beta-propeller fold protein YncE
VMVIRSDEGDFFVADRGPYVSTGTVLLVSKEGFIQRIFSTTIADPYEITVDGNGDMIISNHEHDLSNVTALDNSGIYKIDRLSGVQSKIVGGTTSGTVMPFVTPLGVKVESSGNYILGDPDAFNFTGAVFRVNPSASPVTITELTRGGNLDYLQGVGLAPNGDIYVSNVITPVGSPSQVLKIDPVTGAQTVLASAGNLIYPTGLAVESDGSAVVVVDALTKKVVSIKIPGGTQTVISSDPQFIQPTHIAIEKTGDYLVTDGKSSSFTRRLFRVDKGTGKATQVSINGSFEQPRGVSTAK